MNGTRETRLSLSDIAKMLFRHKKKVLCCMLLAMIASVAAIVFWPRTYLSDAQLFVRVGRESVALDPTATMGDTIPVLSSREVEKNTVLEVLRSRVLAERVVDSLGPETILDKPVGASDQPTRFGGLIPSLDPITDRERAVRQLRGQLRATGERSSDIITVSCKARSPDLAQQIVATLVDAYLDEHARLHRTPDSLSFLAQQAALSQDQLTQAAGELRDAKNKAGLISVEGLRGILEGEMTTIETDLLRTQPLLAASERKITVVREMLERVPERVLANEVAGNPNPAADRMRSQLYDLERRQAELASKFVEGYPVLTATEEQVKRLRGILSEEAPERTFSTTAINPVDQDLEKDLLAEEAKCKALDAEIQGLREQRALLDGRFRDLNGQEAQIAELERKVDLLQENHRNYSIRLEQCRIDKELASERITNVNIVQPASYVGAPASPNKAMVLALGVVGALLSGFGVAAMAEGVEQRKRVPDSVDWQSSLYAPDSVPKTTPRRPVPAAL